MLLVFGLAVFGVVTTAGAQRQAGSPSGSKLTTTEAERAKYHEQCKASCGQNADSSCVTQCETEMYQCVEDNHVVAGWTPAEEEESHKKIEACQKELLEEYKEFGSSKFLAQKTGHGHAYHQRCLASCGRNVNSTCTTQCEAEMYQCVQENQVVAGWTTAEEENARKDRAVCQKHVLDKYKEFGTSSFAAQKIDEDHKYNQRCRASCGKNVNSTCITQCEAEMYQCVRDTQIVAPGESAEEEANMKDRVSCQKAVLKKYEGFGGKVHDTVHLVAQTKDNKRHALRKGSTSSWSRMVGTNPKTW